MSLAPIRAGALFLLLAMSLSSAASASPLDSYRDKNRLIVFSVPTAAARTELANTLAAHRAQLKDRDLLVLDLSPGEKAIPGTIRLQPEAAAALRRQLSLGKTTERAVYILIGKDGGVKARTTGLLDLPRWFALIDQMPMRQREMRR